MERRGREECDGEEREGGRSVMERRGKEECCGEEREGGV